MNSISDSARLITIRLGVYLIVNLNLVLFVYKNWTINKFYCIEFTEKFIS